MRDAIQREIYRPYIYIRSAIADGMYAQKIIGLSKNLPDNGRKTAVLVGFSKWKSFMVDFLPDHNVIFLGHSPRVGPRTLETIFTMPRPEIFAWSYKFPSGLRGLCEREGIPLVVVEDGFLRSLGLGVNRTKPLSLVFDRKAMHFDYRNPSELETILASHDFAADARLMRRADALLDTLTNSGLTKYNFWSDHGRIGDLGLRRNSRKILVIGQVEADLSIRYGAAKPMTNDELLQIALDENPNDEVLFRPHPESVAMQRRGATPALAGNGSRYNVLGPHYSLAECLEAADRVYCITSLAGFEAALRGKSVTLFGAPFYSGWGFTDDRHPVARRKRRLSPREVLAAAYCLYPRYFHPLSNAPISCEDAVSWLKSEQRVRRQVARYA
ncbi:beta-3-deoxy-D-manno-oct-2-ulosonic acid transferase [Mesorhizobium ephedrae]|uniref:Beta-3-deoxy-D-manno-oct-2-ulosonic acid transferase n=2 Tax=Kumtagia ephedrae TaxID=2116701 RepID=A0A2P7S262_9HYPH|nr:beta-3-deoxy-D-manno-oct-2-ulosonic acid transferase [Mesorhizobium ephedrae]